MSASGGIEDDGTFEPVATRQSAGGGADAEPTNITRAAALATLLRFNAQGLVAPVADDLEELGFSRDAVFGLSSERELADALAGGWFNGLNADIDTPDERQLSWATLNENADPRAAIQFLIGLLGSSSERESAVAAAALWRVLSQREERGRWIVATDFDVANGAGILYDDWNPELWNVITADILTNESRSTTTEDEDLQALSLLVTVRLRAAASSEDPVVRSIVRAVRVANANTFSGGGGRPAGSSYPTPPGAIVVSTMVHGTGGWKGNWWRPKAGFYKYIAINHRRNLYNRGAHFSWSGAYNQKQRIQGAHDLTDWAGEVAPNGMQSVFAHSYGGEVAALAAMAGTTTQELIMLSVPATGFVNAAAGHVKRVIDIRTKDDIVLYIAGVPGPITLAPNVTPVILPRMLTGHVKTHEAATWVAHDIASQAGL